MNSFEEKLIYKYISKEKQNEAFLKLESGYPIQYILGNVEFLNTKIIVNENVLIPRFETEYLVNDLIKIIKSDYENPNILEIGTGSGCIAIAINKNVNSNITAIDISLPAINTAKENSKINFTNIDFQNISLEDYDGKKFDIFVSNPPYIAYDEVVDSKTKYEPQNALFAADNGLYFYKIIAFKSQSLLKKGGLIALEFGKDQKQAIIDIFKSIYPNAKFDCHKDLNNFDRYMFIKTE